MWHLSWRRCVLWLSLVTFLTPGAASGGDASDCRKVRVAEAGILLQCESELKAFSLSLDSYNVAFRHDGYHNRFHSICDDKLRSMCAHVPSFTGWFVSAKAKAQSKHGAAAIMDSPSAVSPQLHPFRATPVCDPFDIKVGDLVGRAACFLSDEAPVSMVVLVAADGDFAVLLFFQQQNDDWAGLREKVLALLPKFKTERAKGDLGLLRWMK